MGTSSVRRNLFHHHLSRRPVSAAPPNAPTSGPGMSGLSSQILQSTAPDSSSSLSSGPVDNGEIVVKDKNGGYKLDIPVLPPLVGEDGEEMEGIEGGGGTNSTAATEAGQGEINGREKEKIEANLVEMMYRNRNRQMSSEPHEILNLIYQSLRNKVAALEEDNWMYEPEPDTRV
ncbi:hypothetical protein P175DRAFT_0534457 [Aspergillus ochraceoroseus IBT 24754]|uniref:Uncharacterized protein n=2 Tax=Aspergillus ochraceoroseus TaxID=138278 RepID=A0A2T5LQY5_9EURO|nr:uncharacterized protein P175DRAFT_0534457 [Aspergillus ochraceoroseus IBT 24754]KKK22456.1 hypothetical protein AOCH_001960 [Aspergillus ochraceoroseus]PTU18695.1 hypothetical protein P175DRAFT_0534457 [Aspergillus ochraceoroseus IBT 24754]